MIVQILTSAMGAAVVNAAVVAAWFAVWPAPTEQSVALYWEDTWGRCAGCPRVPDGHTRVDRRADPWPQIMSAASAVHRSPLPYGSYVPFTVDLAPLPPWCGVVLLEPHGATWRGGKRVYLARPIRGATAFKARRCPTTSSP